MRYALLLALVLLSARSFAAGVSESVTVTQRCGIATVTIVVDVCQERNSLNAQLVSRSVSVDRAEADYRKEVLTHAQKTLQNAFRYTTLSAEERSGFPAKLLLAPSISASVTCQRRD